MQQININLQFVFICANATGRYNYQEMALCAEATTESIHVAAKYKIVFGYYGRMTCCSTVLSKVTSLVIAEGKLFVV